MGLPRLVRLLDYHGVNVTLLPSGKLKLSAASEPPSEIIEGIDWHRAALVRRLERGQNPSGHYHLPTLAARPGICASCAQWKQSAPDDLLGICPFLDALEIHAAHRCATPMPRHWTARCAVPAARPPRETISHDATPDR